MEAQRGPPTAANQPPHPAGVGAECHHDSETCPWVVGSPEVCIVVRLLPLDHKGSEHLRL